MQGASTLMKHQAGNAAASAANALKYRRDLAIKKQYEMKMSQARQSFADINGGENSVLFLEKANVGKVKKNEIQPLIDEYKNVVISRTFSKAFGAAGIRVGYLLGNKNLIEMVTKVQLTYPLTGVSVKFASFLLTIITLQF